MPNQLLGDNGTLFWQVIFKIGANGTVPINLIWPGAIVTYRAVQTAAHSLKHRISQLALQFLDNLAHNLARRIPGLLWNDTTEREQISYQVYIGLNGL